MFTSFRTDLYVKVISWSQPLFHCGISGCICSCVIYSWKLVVEAVFVSSPALNSVIRNVMVFRTAAVVTCNNSVKFVELILLFQWWLRWLELWSCFHFQPAALVTCVDSETFAFLRLIHCYRFQKQTFWSCLDLESHCPHEDSSHVLVLSVPPQILPQLLPSLLLSQCSRRWTEVWSCFQLCLLTCIYNCDISVTRSDLLLPQCPP